MVRTFFLFFLLLTAVVSSGQNLTGQWKGEFIDKSISSGLWGGEKCDYVLDLEVKGKTVTGYSYTYFSDGGKKYYTICRLKGTAWPKKNYLEVTEAERTKTNVPDNIANSFQMHKLTWRKEGDNEILEGSWVPAPGQDRTNMGFGTTSLTKRQLTEISPLAKKINAKRTKVFSPEKPIAALAKTNVQPKRNAVPVAKVQPKPVVKNVPKKPAKPADNVVIAEKIKSVADAVVTEKNDQGPEKISAAGFEKRNNTVLQTVNIDNGIIKIELYDNGEVDGDSISLFYNGKVLLAHKRLSEKPISLELPVVSNIENELVMYADNLGTLPPNTALMIVQDGNKRYEIRITSDLKKSGTIRFIHRKQIAAAP